MASNVGPKLELRQGQSLVMTQQLQQSIKLLQLSSIELSEFIEQELEKNPLLTSEDNDDSNSEEQSRDEDRISGEESGDEYEASDGIETPDMDFELAPTNDWDSADAGDDEPHDAGDSALHYTGLQTSADDGDAYSPDQNITRQVSLKDHLQEQLILEVPDPTQRMIGLHLIDMLSESGYIEGDIGQVANLLECDVAQVEATLLMLQNFDPVGIFARNLTECLSLQLKEKDRFDPAMQKLIANLELLAKRDIAALIKICEVDEEDLRQMIKEVKALNPRPASGFMHDVVQTVIPDIFLRRIKGGGWQIELNTSVLPKVLVNRQYYSELSGKAQDKQSKKYLSEQLASASWLVKALDQRAQTILKVTTEIVARQDGFFRHGIRYLKPLILKDVAEKVDLHESTISRVTSNKFISTPRGTYELKYFFTSTILNSSGGENYSSRSVMYMIKEMVEQETADAILSDDTLSSMLKDRGIDCARRTVTKYREAMNIGSSVERRRQKAQQKQDL